MKRTKLSTDTASDTEVSPVSVPDLPIEIHCLILDKLGDIASEVECIRFARFLRKPDADAKLEATLDAINERKTNMILKIDIPFKNDEVYLPFAYGRVSIDWGDGTESIVATDGRPELTKHRYQERGVYTITISPYGDPVLSTLNNRYSWLPVFGSFSPDSDIYNAMNMLVEFVQLGRLNTFYLNELFEGMAHIPPIGHLDVCRVQNMDNMFSGCDDFNQPLNNWDTSSLTSIVGIFRDASSFNQDLDNWNTKKVTKMRFAFQGATSFNGNIENWDLSSTVDISFMFRGASAFNRDLSNWNMGNGIEMYKTFEGATSMEMAI